MVPPPARRGPYGAHTRMSRRTALSAAGVGVAAAALARGGPAQAQSGKPAKAGGRGGFGWRGIGR